MNTGDFVFRAVIYDSDMSSYTETYTVSVSDSSVPTTPAPAPTPEPEQENDDGDDTGTTQSSGLYPTNGAYTASAGGTHDATCVTSTPYTSVAWYVNGFCWETDAGDETATEASFSYTFPSDASGEYTIYVEVTEAGNYYTDSYTVTIP